VVRGRWDRSCGREQIAYVRPPAGVHLAPVGSAAAPAKPRISTPSLVATLWAETGGKLRGRVVESEQPAGSKPRKPLRSVIVDDDPAPGWSSEFLTGLPELLREMNKTSNNLAARKLLLSLGRPSGASAANALRNAQDRMQSWLRGQGVADTALHIDIGSGQSRNERGTPRAMVQLLHNAWRASGSQAFVNSLPIAGVDGTLARRMRTGSATGQAFLKTGTLSDTRALAGYVRAKSGKVYAVAALANHAHASRATPALDAFIEWVAQNG
jgi:D-alanyl-D-alanine carboxypeptidase/D-alanyl-D-alanine-endopeptidase (penicillin-binding protein 4)